MKPPLGVPRREVIQGNISRANEVQMLRTPLLLLAVLGLGAAAAPMPDHPIQRHAGLRTSDTVQAGSSVLDPGVLHPYELHRALTMTRGDSVRPFGKQSESLAPGTLAGRPVLIHVVTFDTPNARTVDSSWVDPATLSPIRMQSSNKFRTVNLEFAGDIVRATTTPAGGVATAEEHRLDVRPFEWNMLPLALSSLPLRVGYRAELPVFSDRAGRVVWYSVRVAADTFITRPSGYRSPMWRLQAHADSGGPNAEWWVSQRHHFLEQALVSEPGVAMVYEREM